MIVVSLANGYAVTYLVACQVSIYQALDPRRARHTGSGETMRQLTPTSRLTRLLRIVLSKKVSEKLFGQR